jgi:hypothetical protein
MPTTPMFDAQLLGQTEKAANAILDRLLAGPGLSEPEWVALNLALMGRDALLRAQLVDRIQGALKVRQAEAEALIAGLADAHLLSLPDDDSAPVTVTDAGRRVHAEIRAATTEITRRLWGDLPSEDLAAAGRVLSTVLARANAELARD